MSISSSFHMIVRMRNKAVVIGCRNGVGCGGMTISICRGVVMCYSLVSVGMMMTLSKAGTSMMVAILMLVAMVWGVMVSVAVGMVVAVVQARVSC